MDVTVDDQTTSFVAVVRERVEMDALPAFYDRAYGAVLQEVAAAGLAITGPAFGWYRDMPTDTVDLAAGFPVDADSARGLGNGVEIVELPGGPAAVGVHVGSYETLPAAWREVQTWFAGSGARMRGDFLEVYLSDPSDEPSLNETRLVLPILP